jgi:signal transduction histidine kinase
MLFIGQEMFLRILVFLSFAGFCGAQEAVKVTNIPNVRAIPYSEDRADVSVATEGVVVWVEAAPVRYFYIQDRSAGIRVEPAAGVELPAVGDAVRIRGRLAWTDNGVQIQQAAVEVLGHPGLPKTRRASTASMATGAENGIRVNVRGYLRQAEMADGRLRLTLDSDGVRISVVVVDADLVNAEDFIGRYAYANGVVSPGVAPGSFEILVSSFDHVYFRKREPGGGGDPIPISDLFKYRKGYNWGDRVAIRGRVIGALGGEIHINDGTGGIVVRGGDSGRYTSGAWVSAVGFPEFDDGVQVFSDAVLAKVDPFGQVVPDEVEASDLLNPAANHRYVSVTGRLVDFMSSWPAGSGGEGGAPLVLVLNDGGIVFEAMVPSAPDGFSPEAGALLRVTGVCQISPDQGGKPGSFAVLVFSPLGVEVVKGPGFFNERRLLILLCMTLLVLAVTALSAYGAARKNAELLAEVRERKAITAERGRLAGDLHDTLEQMLTAIHLQLHSLGLDKNMPTETQGAVASIRELVRQCHVEIRNFVWDLRPAALGHYDLPRALERMAKSLVLGTPTRISVKRPASLPKIPSSVEDNLLRIGQEALTNAVKHGKPGEITIRFEPGPSDLLLEIGDDGEGASGDLVEGVGLRGMKERIARLQGKLEILPGRDKGMLVRVKVPLS